MIEMRMTQKDSVYLIGLNVHRKTCFTQAQAPTWFDFIGIRYPKANLFPLFLKLLPIQSISSTSELETTIGSPRAQWS